VVELVDRGEVRGTVLDAGCGAGHNALFLAGRGFGAVGIDVAPTAIRRAREKAGGLDVEFAVEDVLDLGGYRGRFDTVIDIGCLHSLAVPDRPRYAAALHAATRPDALAHVRCFTDRNAGVPGLSEDALRAATATGWEVTDLVAAVDEVTVPERLEVEFWYLSLRRLGRP
jgi:cyclopropane fatty-acyl-phospholipid synthase-like methyltransferase